MSPAPDNQLSCGLLQSPHFTSFSRENVPFLGAVKGAPDANFGAVKGRKRAVILVKSSREGSAGPGNPG
jgi:hypothetical protein